MTSTTEAQRAYQREYARTHREDKRVKVAAWRALNPEAGADWRAQHREERRIYKAAYYVTHRDEIVAKAMAWNTAHRESCNASLRNLHRRRREAPFTWERLDPWPGDCQCCGSVIDSDKVYPDPGAATLGHEPPVAWMLRHPEYSGPLILRPEHWACNSAKSDKPDWEVA